MGTNLRVSFCLFCSFIDATYADPLGEAPARPKTAGRQRPQQVEDEFGDEEIGDDLLPEWENKDSNNLFMWNRWFSKEENTFCQVANTCIFLQC